jgi:DNA-binding CsgD family transcriptional regulator
LEEDVHVEEVSAAAFGLFGREDTLRTLSGVLDGGGSAVVAGSPGVGKSSLLKVADQLAQRRGRRVLSVTPREFDRGLPFAGLAELIAQCPQGADRHLPEPQRHGLAVALQRVEPGEVEVDALAVPLAVQGVLTHLAGSESLALIIDDLQWLDQASLGSLAFALRRICAEPNRLSVLIGTRPEGTDNDLVHSLADPRHELTLPPLEDWAIGQLLRTRLGARWTPPASAGVARASSGNPFLALMIAQAMQSDLSKWCWSAQDGQNPVFPVPPSLAGLLGEKVTLLPETAREVLLLVSAAGRLTVAQLQGLVPDAQVRTALEAAADWDVATVAAGSVVTFTHPLLASAIYEAATPAERRRVHRVLADLLDDAVERARHRSRTVTAPDEPVARELEQAADISWGRGAPQLAGELLEGAALATPSGVDPAAGYGRLLRAVDAYLAAGDKLTAGVVLDKASGLSADPEQQAQVLVRRIRLAPHDGRADRSLTEQALRLAPIGSEVRAVTLNILGEAHRHQGHGRLAWRVIQRAVTESAALKRFDVQVGALNERLMIERLWGWGEPQQTMRDLERLVHTELELPSVEWAWARSFFAPWTDETAETHVRDAITSTVSAGRYGDLSALYICLVLVLIRSSRVREAQAALDEADRSGAWTTSSLQEGMARVLVNEYAGDLAVAREVAHGAVARSRSIGSAYWRGGFLAQLGFVETSARNWQAALEHLRELAEIFASTKMVDLEQLLWGVDYADAALQVGATDEVEVAISVLRRQGSAGRPEAAIAADRCEALLMAARGDVDTALNQLVKIVDQQGSECPFETARSRLALGQVYRRAGYKGMATKALTAAAEAFDELGTPRWAERARGDAGRAGLHSTGGTLTETERRVAELVGSGHSNHETAAALFISVKTVEANLTRIYRKLSVRSRTELAHRLTTHEEDSARAPKA